MKISPQGRGSRAKGQETPNVAPLIVAGIMSGTSADGIDIALCRISPSRRDNPGVPLRPSRPSRFPFAPEPPKLKLLAHTHTPYAKSIREAVLAAQDAKRTSTAELARLHWLLGELYADALATTVDETKIKPHLIALHGQTIYHQPESTKYHTKSIRTTWQIGEASVAAERLRLPIVSDFRPADLAAGGQGAPLVPMLDFALFRHATRNRVLLNLGGIANLTAIPADAGIDDVLAFDTGPANMVIDALTAELFQKPFDKDGKFAAQGSVLQPVINKLSDNPFFSKEPPKSCGREQFGSDFVCKFLNNCEKLSSQKHDAVATATAFTAQTIRDAYARFCWPHLGTRAPLARGTDLYVSGGGAHNATLMRMLTDAFSPLGVRVATTETASKLPVEAKEAAAFALLGWLTWHGLPGNVPSATGASRPVVLGKITYA